MKARLLFLVITCALISCTKIDELQNNVDSLMSRVEALEKRCDEMNSNISSLRTLIEAVQAQKKITNVASTSTGYVITFSDKSSITLKHGEDGSTPTISVRQESDGVWYWVLNGNWLLDSNGKKIRATGTTPLMKIENDYWYISYNEGKTWSKLDKATGKDGDSFFKSVSQDDQYVYIMLADGTVINIPKENAFALSFDKTTFHPATETMTIPFTIIAAGNDLNVVTFSDSNISTKAYMESKAVGHLDLTFIGGNHNGNVLVAAKSNGKTVMEILEFEEGVLSTSSAMEYWVGTEGKDINVSISRNMDINIESSISWITAAPKTKALVQENMCITVIPNETYQDREGKVTIKGDEGISLVFTIHQAQKDYIKLDKNSVSILDEETINLSYTTNVSGIVTWSSSDPGVATVDSNGLVTAVSKGETTITVKTQDGKCSDSCIVNVKRFSDGISITCSGGSFMINGTLILYGSQMNWYVRNNTGHTVTVDNVYLVDGENGNKTGTLSLNTELENGKSVGWTISVPLRGIHYPVTAVFSITCEGEKYSASGTYTYSRPF